MPIENTGEAVRDRIIEGETGRAEIRKRLVPCKVRKEMMVMFEARLSFLLNNLRVEKTGSAETEC